MQIIADTLHIMEMIAILEHGQIMIFNEQYRTTIQDRPACREHWVGNKGLCE